ncbi:hypothetical protein AcV7_004281 [Taiwanofungus camphoratus]|nr:hypothetical protein AcV7_004281 [Antrodia cinnamomea]
MSISLMLWTRIEKQIGGLYCIGFSSLAHLKEVSKLISSQAYLGDFVKESVIRLHNEALSREYMHHFRLYGLGGPQIWPLYKLIPLSSERVQYHLSFTSMSWCW